MGTGGRTGKTDPAPTWQMAAPSRTPLEFLTFASSGFAKEEACMEGHMYPPTRRFSELTPVERATRLEVAADLLNILQFWRGDPRLNYWEEGFLASLVQLLQSTQGKAKITPKQWDKIHQILDKMDRDEEAAAEMAEEDIEV
jgi:hypothetical protein